MENAKVVEVRASIGDRVGPQDVLLSIETQKAVEDLPFGESGIVRAVQVKVGDEVNVHDLLAVLTDTADEPISLPGRTLSPETVSSAVSGPAPDERAESDPPEGKTRALPAARRRAKELGINLSDVKGTGPNGRISVADVEGHSGQGASGAEGAELSARRRALIAQMEGSRIPQIAISRSIDVSGIASSREGSTFTSRLLGKVARALQTHRALRSSIANGSILAGPVDIAVAIDSEHGLVAPVVRGADRLSTAEISSALEKLRERATANRLTSDELRDGRFAVTNLGMLGVDLFTPLLFSGQTAVLAVGRARELETGASLAWFTVAVDHRVADGAEAARFLETLQGAIAEGSG